MYLAARSYNLYTSASSEQHYPVDTSIHCNHNMKSRSHYFNFKADLSDSLHPVPGIANAQTFNALLMCYGDI